MNKKNNENRVFTWRINSFIALIFLLGMFAGVKLSSVDINSLKNSFNNSDLEVNRYVNIYGEDSSTSTNATSGNATSSNATSANATSTNATSSNATSTNARPDVVYLNKFSLKSNKAKPEQKVYVDMQTSGNCLKNVSVTLKNDSTKTSFTVSLVSPENNPYFIVPKGIQYTTYSVTNVLITAISSNNNTFTKHYSLNPGTNVSEFKFNSTLRIESDKKVETNNNKVEEASKTEEEQITLKAIELKSKEAYVEDMIYLNLNTNKTLTNAKLIFKLEGTDKEVITYVKALNYTNQYITFPTNTTAGTYELDKAVLTTNEITSVYAKSSTDESVIKYDFNVKINIKEKPSESLQTKTSVEYNSEDLTDTIIADIEKYDNKATITINADTYPIISTELFNIIKGTNRTLIINYKDNVFKFNGNDISIPKDIDVSLSVSSLESQNLENQAIYNLVTKGIVLNFASNGNLPGTAEVKIKADETINSVLNRSSINIYYFDDINKKFEIVEEDVNLVNNEYYVFKLTHNSKFLLTNEKLSSSLLQDTNLGTDTNVVRFLESANFYLLIIGGSIMVVIIVVIIILIVRKNKLKKQNPLYEER